MPEGMTTNFISKPTYFKEYEARIKEVSGDRNKSLWKRSLTALHTSLQSKCSSQAVVGIAVVMYIDTAQSNSVILKLWTSP